MDVDDFVSFLGERHLTRAEVPPALREWIEVALARGLVAEDCRDRLFSLR